MWQDNAQSHHRYVEIAGRHHRDRLSRATVGVQRSGTSMSAVHQPVLTLVGTAHGSSPRNGGRPSKAGLDARQSELAFVVARMWGTSCLSPGCAVTWLRVYLVARLSCLSLLPFSGEPPIPLQGLRKAVGKHSQKNICSIRFTICRGPRCLDVRTLTGRLLCSLPNRLAGITA